MKPISLIVRPARHAGESYPHYLLRLAHSNYLEGIEQLSAAIRQKPTVLLSMTDTARAQLLRGTEFRSLTEPVMRLDSALGLIRRNRWNRRRFCPDCVREAVPSPTYFDFPLSLRCVQHQVYLEHLCPECGVELKYLASTLTACTCGFELANAPSRPVDHSVDLFETQFAPWRADEEWMTAEHIVIEKEIHVGFALHRIISLVGDQMSNQRLTNPHFSQDTWARLRNIISPWPHGLARKVFEAKSQSENFNPYLFRSALRRCESPALRSLLNAIDCELLQRRTVYREGSTTYISLNSVRKLMKLDAQATQDFFLSGYFNKTLVTGNSSYKRFWVEEEEFQKLEEGIARLADLKTASRILGCSEMTIRGLERDGWLTSLSFPVKSRSLWFSHSSLDELIQKFRELVQPMENPGECVPLSSVKPATHACKYWRPMWSRLISRVFDGTIPLFSLNGEPGWTGVGVRKVDILSCN